MKTRVVTYVTLICVLAVVGLLAVYLLALPSAPYLSEVAVAFAAMGLLSHALSHNAAGAASGSTSFIPFVAAVGLAPSWGTVVAIGASVALVEVLSGRAAIKATFNVAQITLSLCVALLIFFLGTGETMFEATSFWSLPLAVGSLAFLLVNGFAVSGAMAVSEGAPFITVWKRNTRGSIAYDFLSLPVVFMFVWAYRSGGITGAALLAVPLLGFRQLYKTNWMLQKNNQDLLEVTVAAIEARDPYTSGHSRRVSRNAKIIARAIGLSSREVERVATAALLHDVGKIYEVFAPILRKPDRLTPEEWAIMQTHPVKSAELVMKASLLSDIVAPVRHHHENWDGSGYPDGLSGENIPLGARIIMFADTIDAMLTDRPYRKALTEVEVRAELIRCSGKQFDPQMCEKLMASPQFRLLFSPVGNPTPASSTIFSLSKVG